MSADHKIYLDDLQVGQEFISARRTVTETDIVNFCGLTGDYSELHSDYEFAKSGPFGRPVAHGTLVLAIASGLRTEHDNIAFLAWLEVVRRFKHPVFIGDTLRTRHVIAEVRPSKSSPERGLVTTKLEILNQDDVVVQEGSDTSMVERRQI